MDVGPGERVFETYQGVADHYVRIFSTAKERMDLAELLKFMPREPDRKCIRAARLSVLEKFVA